MYYEVVPNHIYGPAIIAHGWGLVACGPLEPIERIAAALNAAETADMSWGVPEFFDLNRKEADQVIRALSKRVQMLTREHPNDKLR